MAEIKIIILAIILASRHQLHLNSSGRVSCRVRNPNFRTIVMLVCLLSQSRAPPEIKHTNSQVFMSVQVIVMDLKSNRPWICSLRLFFPLAIGIISITAEVKLEAKNSFILISSAFVCLFVFHSYDLTRTCFPGMYQVLQC